MQPQHDWPDVFTAVRSLHAESVESWRRSKAAHMQLADATATLLDSLETQVTQRAGGNIWVTVCAKGKQSRHDETFAFYLQKTGKRVRRAERTPKAKV